MSYDEENAKPRENKEIIPFDSSLVKRGLEMVTKIKPRKIFVPKDYQTIQEAVDHANNGDIIELSAGIYDEIVHISKPIQLVCKFMVDVKFKGDITYHPYTGSGTVKGIEFNWSDVDIEKRRGLHIYGGKLNIDCCRFLHFQSDNRNRKSTDTNPSSAVVIDADTRVLIKDSGFVYCDIGLNIKDNAKVELNKCEFIHALVQINENSILTSHHSTFDYESIIFHGKRSTLISNYDTFWKMGELIHFDRLFANCSVSKDMPYLEENSQYPTITSCMALFKNATVLCDYLFGIIVLADEEFAEYVKTPVASIKPVFSFSNSIVIFNRGIDRTTVFTQTKKEDTSESLEEYITSSADKRIIHFMDNNLIRIPPDFNDPDPQLILEIQVVLGSNSPARNAASDGKNLGAWQG